MVRRFPEEKIRSIKLSPEIEGSNDSPEARCQKIRLMTSSKPDSEHLRFHVLMN